MIGTRLYGDRMKPWTRISEHDGTSGYLPLSVRRFELPDGTEVDWDIFGAEQTVAIVAITDDDRIVLARQFRAGPERVLDELPGGFVDPGESVLGAAARELLEETGYAGDLELAGADWLAAASRTRRHVVVARHARRVAEPDPEPGEFIEVVLLALADLRTHLRSGELTDVDLGYLALDHLGLLDRPEPTSGDAG